MPAPTYRVGSRVKTAVVPFSVSAVTWAHEPSTIGVLSGPTPLLLQSNGVAFVTVASRIATFPYGSAPCGTSARSGHRTPRAASASSAIATTAAVSDHASRGRGGPSGGWMAW